MRVRYVLLDVTEAATLDREGVIPREDVDVYLTAKQGQAECFVSANRELVRAMASQTDVFECLSPEAFVDKYSPLLSRE